MAPVSNPRLIVAVMIDEPRGKGYYGGTVAGPVFSSVTSGALQLLGVPPDAPIEATPNAPARGAAPQKPGAAPKAAAQPKTAAAQKAATPVKTAAQSGATVQVKAAG